MVLCPNLCYFPGYWKIINMSKEFTINRRPLTKDVKLKRANEYNAYDYPDFRPIFFPNNTQSQDDKMLMMKLLTKIFRMRRN